MEGNRQIRRQLPPAVAMAVIVHLSLFGVCILSGVAERSVTVTGTDAVLSFSLADLVTAVQNDSRQPVQGARETLASVEAASAAPQPETAGNVVPLPAIRKTLEKRKVSRRRQSGVSVQPSSSPSVAIGRGEASTPSRQPPADTAGAPAMRKGDVVAARPRYQDNPPPEYPRLARRRGWQGKVLLDVTVLADGSVGEIRLDKSSSYDLLDRAAVTTVRSWVFTPEYRDGRPVAARVRVPVRFALNE